MDKPKGYESFLSKYKPCLFDSYCGEPVGWGFEIKKRMPEDMFNGLRQFGSLECIYPTWFLITKYLTRREAIEKYGDVTEEDRGPRGGFRSITFGKKTFMRKELAL